MQKGKHELSWVGLLIALFMVGTLAGAEEVQHLSITVPGGMPGWPIMTGIQRTGIVAKITWDGPAGYYQLYQAFGLTSPTWQKYGSPNLNRTTNVTTLHTNTFFRVLGPSPQYAGAQACLECHESIHTREMTTRHAGAFTDPLFKAQGGQTNRSCLPCHTVGYGLPTGFVSKDDPNTNPRLAGVQCENCHGPAANHAANPMDLTTRPRMDIAGQVCGGCHNGAQNPTFDEWKTSGHFAVVEDMNRPDRIVRCGQCHSGTARLALINGIPTNTITTTLTNDANVGITCAVCHDPHAIHVWTNVVAGIVYTNQLRQALSSTNDFFLTTSDNFTNKYNPNINVCAQCHNHRGASWTNTTSAPHHSPQYNMLLGTLPAVPGGVSGGPATHAGVKFYPWLTNASGGLLLVTNQCVTCHMQTRDYQHGPPEIAAVTGHTFGVTSYEACVDCHGSGADDESVGAWHDYFADQIQVVKDKLDEWALTKAPDVLRTNYGVLSWEYTRPGDLSSGSPGPNELEQKTLIPDNIRKARFYLYLVAYDGSYGLHNGFYTKQLLDAALNWVLQTPGPTGVE